MQLRLPRTSGLDDEPDTTSRMRQTPFSRFGRMAAMPPVAGVGQRIGLLGGSFNPPHAAHLLISEIALRRLGLDRLWWLVTPGNPLKMGNFLMPLADRVAACQEMAKDPRIVITTFEKDLQTAFTAATLDFLRVRYPGTHFVWIMGADCLAQFHRWQQWQHIFETMPVAVIDRPAWRMKAAASTPAKTYSRFRIPELRAASLPGAATPAWSLITGPLSTLSSTQLRAARGIGGDPAGKR